jgi:hypothetical protein
MLTAAIAYVLMCTPSGDCSERHFQRSFPDMPGCLAYVNLNDSQKWPDVIRDKTKYPLVKGMCCFTINPDCAPK